MNDEEKHYQYFCPQWQTKAALVDKGMRYCAHDALSFALISGLCYEGPSGECAASNDVIDTQMKQWGFNEVEHFEASHDWDIDTQGFFASNDTRSLIVFRGTDSKKDWRTNLQFSKEPGPFNGSFVHKGIQEAFFHVALDIGRLLERHHNANKELWLAGHSLGGALSVILAAYLLKRDIHIDGLYTYAAPRIGDEVFSRTLDEKLPGLHIRVVNENDVVPYLPLEALFTHSGTLVMLTETGENLVDVDPGVFNSLKQNIMQLFRKPDTQEENPFIDYHMLWTKNGYVNKLLQDLKHLLS